MNVCRYNDANSLPASTWEPASTGEIVRRAGRRGPILPMTPTATPISATTKQQQQNNNDENQVHSKSPLRSRLQMEGTDPGELSSARLEFHYGRLRYQPSWRRRMKKAAIRGGLTPACHPNARSCAQAAARIAERPALIAKPATGAMRDHRTTNRWRWPPGTERCRSRRSANDGSAAVPFNHSSAIAWTARYKRRTEAKSFAGWPPDRSGSREA
jgi:hypothetical protein